MTLDLLKDQWCDTPAYHENTKYIFETNVNNDKELKALRDWVESHIWGFGERAFYWMWKLIVDEMPKEFIFLEIGVFRGQVLALIQTLANQQNKTSYIAGISPMSSQGGYWESDYHKDVAQLFDEFKLDKKYTIIDRDSTHPFAIQAAELLAPIDILYIDGGHEEEVVKKDMDNYLPLLKPGGYLIMDDCCNTFNLPDGYFRGHEQVTKAVNEVLPPVTPNDQFEFLFSVVHNRVWRKK